MAQSNNSFIISIHNYYLIISYFKKTIPIWWYLYKGIKKICITRYSNQTVCTTKEMTLSMSSLNLASDN